MSIEDQTYNDESEFQDQKNDPKINHVGCQWKDCKQQVSNIPEMIHHMNQHADSDASLKKSCYWRGCDQYGVEKSSSAELRTHIQNHLGETDIICPVPECDKIFVNIEDLTQHLNLNHDLVSINHFLHDNYNQETVVDQKNLIYQTYKYRTPWWFTNEFIDTLNQGTDDKLNMGLLYSMKFNLNQYKIGNHRYKKYLKSNTDTPLINPTDANNSYKTIIKIQQNFDKTHQTKNNKKNKNDDSDDDFESYANDNGNAIGFTDSNSILLQLSQKSLGYKKYYQKLKSEEDLEEIENCQDLSQLQQLYENLSSKLSTSLKINKIVTSELSKSINLKRKQYIINQILLDANIELGLPPLTSNSQNRVTQDRVDWELLEDDEKLATS